MFELELAAIQIQSAWRGYSVRRRVLLLRQTAFIALMRESCANQIQRFWRGSCERHMLVPNVQTCIISWRFATGASGVMVACSIFDWKPMKMRRCPLKGDCRLCIPVRRIRPDPFFLYKFMVDGVWTCDAGYPMLQDSAGNINNIYYIPQSYVYQFISHSFRCAVIPRQDYVP